MTDWTKALSEIAPQELQRARDMATQTGEPIALIIRRLGLASDASIASALSRATGLTQAQRAHYSEAPFWGEILSTRFLAKICAVPLALEGDHLIVAMADPTQIEAVDALRAAARGRLRIVIGQFDDIERALLRDTDGGFAQAETDEDDAEGLLRAAGETPTVRLVDDFLALAARRRASDLHIESFRDRLRIRIRIDGVLHEAGSISPAAARSVISRVKIIAGLDIADRRLPQDGRARVTLGDRTLDLRVATAPAEHGENVSIRLLEDRTQTIALSGLGFSEPQLALLHSALSAPFGLIIVAGPTGAGKSTTLAGMVSQLNHPSRKIISIEDPIEHRLDGVHQIAVRPEIGLTFATALRSILRHDPDILVVGELRDGETAQIAVDAALTGHLVLATVHANDAAGAVPRLLDLGVEPSLLRSTLRLSLAQRLVRRLCATCRRQSTHGASAEAGSGLGAGFEAVGCPSCEQTGYRGRVGVFEPLPFDAARAALIRSGVSSQDLIQSDGEALPSLLDDAYRQVRAGITSAQEIRRVLGIVDA